MAIWRSLICISMKFSTLILGLGRRNIRWSELVLFFRSLGIPDNAEGGRDNKQQAKDG